MSPTDAAIGMMDGAYFTSRKEILDFFNSLLDLNLAKIEQTASGAVACQLTEYIFPNSIPMSRVNWEAKASHEYVQNYKLLQNAFNKNKIQKYVDVDKLIRAKYQDNLEFCQWLKAFHDQAAGGRDPSGYDPVAVRARGKGGKSVSKSAAKNNNSRQTRQPAPKPAPKATSGGRNITGGSARPSSSGSGRASGSTTATASRVVKEHATQNSVVSSAGSMGSSSSKRNTGDSRAADAALLKSSQELKEAKIEFESALSIAKADLSTIEAERDFYFEKLRGIEIMMQVYQDEEDERKGDSEGSVKEVNALMKRIFKVMYATAESQIGVDDEGNLIGDVSDEEEEAEEEELLTTGIDETVTTEVEKPVMVPATGSSAGNICVDDDDDSLLDESLLDED